MKSNSECLSNTIRQLKTAAKRKCTIEGFWTKTMASPPERKKGEEIEKQSGSTTNENTPAIVLDEESEYYDIFCSA